ncbi:unnamed protein product [Cylicocyclus nassatus]|uniref:Uncharacterized protein n=1 Tax=Cylicocyclus nassatus TaxID=53992 RepID=A0AA36H7I3_CYLNA|nr:unnamed protein product [Cylicocyclus nassatus]
MIASQIFESAIDLPYRIFRSVEQYLITPRFSTSFTMDGVIPRRHDSLDVEVLRNDELDRNGRFPSANVNSHQFLRIASWDKADDNASTPSNRNFAGTMRSWYRNISRRKLFIILIILLIVLFIAAVIITILFVVILPGHHDNHGFTAIVVSPTAAHTTTVTTTPLPYPTGYVVGTMSRYVAIGEVDSVMPDMRGYKYRKQLLTWGNDTLAVLSDNVTLGELYLDTGNCTSCTLISVDDECLHSNATLSCDQTQAIYCCSECPKVDSMCRVKGVPYEFFGDLVESRVSIDNDALILTTASHLNSSNCVIQLHKMRSNGSFSGPIQSCYNAQDVEEDVLLTNVATITFSPKTAFSADFLVGLDSHGSIILYNLTYDTPVAHIPMGIQGDVMSISTTVQDDHVMVAFLQMSKFYALRYNLVSGCVSVLGNYYQKFDYSGTLRDLAWTGESLIIWYENREGVNIVQFQFKWNSDSTC